MSKLKEAIAWVVTFGLMIFFSDWVLTELTR
jgi:hypothetical protein